MVGEGDSTHCPSDLIFVLDESSSVSLENFNLMKDFVSRLVARLDVDSGNTRVGAVCFSHYIHTEDAFNMTKHSSLASVQSGISALVYDEGLTHTHLALHHVRTKMLTAAAGDRPGVPNVVILLADGQSTNRSKTLVCIHTLDMNAGTFALKNVCSGSESSIYGSELTLPGVKIPSNFCSWERKCRP